MLRLFPSLIAVFILASCSQKPVSNFETGQIMSVKMGTIKKVNKFMVTRDAAGEGAFAGMASNAVTAITPGILAEGTSKIASATGSIMDSKLETVAKVRIRVLMDPPPPKPAPAPKEGEEAKPVEAVAKAPDEFVEIIQNDIPGMRFVVGEKVVISTTSVPGNVWPE